MSANHIPVQFSDRKRRAVDRLTRRLVTCCGVAILLLMPHYLAGRRGQGQCRFRRLTIQRDKTRRTALADAPADLPLIANR